MDSFSETQQSGNTMNVQQENHPIAGGNNFIKALNEGAGEHVMANNFDSEDDDDVIEYENNDFTQASGHFVENGPSDGSEYITSTSQETITHIPTKDENLLRGIELGPLTYLAQIVMFNFGTQYNAVADAETGKVYVARQPVVSATTYYILQPGLHKDFIAFLGENVIDLEIDEKRSLKAVAISRSTLSGFKEAKRVPLEKSNTIAKADGDTNAQILKIFGFYTKALRKLATVTAARDDWAANDVAQPPRVVRDEYGRESIHHVITTNPHQATLEEIAEKNAVRLEKMNAIVESLSTVGENITMAQALEREDVADSAELYNFITSF